MARSRKQVLALIERHKRAYYDHIEKARTYQLEQDQEYARKTAERIRETIEKLAASIGERIEL